MPPSPNTLLSSLKDFQTCNDALAACVKQTILEPFQLDLSQLDPTKRRSQLQQAPPTRQEFKSNAKKLAPLAMRIVTQNIDSLRRFKEWRNENNYNTNTPESARRINTIKHCLIDTSFYATAALKHMKACAPLKPWDLEKTTSNLIGKLVDLGEPARALDELRKFRIHLASHERIQLDKNLTLNLTTGVFAATATTTPLTESQPRLFGHTTKSKTQTSSPPPPGLLSPRSKGVLTETPNQQGSLVGVSPGQSADGVVLVGGRPSSMTSWEEEMIIKYADLFTFPLDTTINDRSMILLVLAYQINAIRSWCDINEGIMIKYLPILMDRPGNSIDWCKHLMSLDPVLAKKQFDLLYRHLMKMVNRPVVFDDPFQSMSIQALALRSAAYTDMVSLRSLCEQFVGIGVNYEKSTSQAKYDQLQKHCNAVLQILQPQTQNPSDVEAYFIFCEYYAYVSRKAKSYSGAMLGFKSMVILSDKALKTSSTQEYYDVAYAIHAKLSLCAVQMDLMAATNSYSDISALFMDINSNIQSCATIMQNKSVPSNSYTESALMKLSKTLHTFRHSSNRLWEILQRQHQTTNISSDDLTDVLSPEPSLSNWEHHIETMAGTLQQCSVLVPCNLALVKKLGCANSESKSSVSPANMMLTFVDIMILLAKIHYDAKDANTYYQAYDHLATAEQLCSEQGYSAGYRWISATYYTLGAEMVTLNSLTSAIYPLRKACSLLEKDPQRLGSDAGKLQLAKRYEVFGTCCQKNGDFEGAANAYRMSLRRLPPATIEQFATGADHMPVSKMAEQQPFVPKLMDRFIRSSFYDHEQKTLATEVMDLSLLTPIQKCVLYECELKVLLVLSLRLNVTKEQNVLVGSLLHHYTAEQFPIRRARTLLVKVRTIHANGLASDPSIRAAINLVLEAQDLLQYKNFGSDTNLLTYRRHYLALTFSWLGILRRELCDMSPKPFVMALQSWGKILKKVYPLSSPYPTLEEDMEQVYREVDDLDSLYDHLRLLADLFNLVGFSTLHLNTMRLLLKLNNGLRESAVDHVSDAVIITVDIARLYADLGYSGKAGLEFSKVKSILEKQRSSRQAEAHYLIQYSQHLSTTGDHVQSQDVFNAAKPTWEKEEESHPTNKLMRSMKQHALKSFMISDCHLARSTISLYKESLDTAIMDATSSYQVLSEFLRSIKKRNRVNPNDNIFLVDNKPNARKAQDQPSIAASDLLFKEHQWTVAMKLGACYQRLALLHMTRGTWRDAQYYLLQGRQLAERVKSNAMVFQFLLLLSDSYLRTGQFDKAKSYLEIAFEIQPKGPTYLREEAQMRSAVAKMDASKNFLDAALESYTAVDNLLQQMMDPVYIVALEKLSESDIHFEEQIALAREAQLPESGWQDNAHYECQSLQTIQGENASLKALAMARNGALDDAFRLLQRYEDHGAMLTKEDLLKATSAHIRLMMAKDEYVKQSNMPCAGINVLALPSLGLSSQRGVPMVNRSRAAHLRRLIRDSVAQALDRILATHRKCARIEGVPFVGRLCSAAGSAMFLKNQASIGQSILVNNYAALSGFYLEMAKSIGLRREMQYCLDQKLMIHLPSMSGALTWPKPITDQTDLDTEMENGNDGSSSSKTKRPASLLSERTRSHLMNLRHVYQQEHDLDDAEFQNYFIDILPAHWTVCSISLDIALQEMYVAQYRAGEPPLVVKLPLNRADERRRRRHFSGANCGITYEQAFTEFEDIIQHSDETIQSNKAALLKKEIEDWWITRSLLDTRMKKLLEQMERSWIGGFKGLFSGHYQVYSKGVDAFRQSLKTILMENVYGSSTASTNKRALDTSDRILHMILCLGPTPSDLDVEDVVYFLLACFESHEVIIDYSNTFIDTIVPQVKHAIIDYHAQAKQAGVDTTKRLAKEHLILIPDKHTQQFPLESLPYLRPQSVSRLPCISFLRDRILHGLAQKNKTSQPIAEQDTQNNTAWKDITIDASRTYYVLNPSGDLKYTQSKFENVFSSMHTWEGVTQKKISDVECRSIFMQKDLYMYFGHSAGQSMISGQLVRKLPRCPVALLMGCSSGVLQSHGEFDPHGYVVNYLLAGSPAVAANLWDVTDKSIDQVSKRMMEKWGLFNGAADSTEHIQKSDASLSLVDALVLSRDECQLPYLIGASTVVYGVPVYIRQ